MGWAPKTAYEFMKFAVGADECCAVCSEPICERSAGNRYRRVEAKLLKTRDEVACYLEGAAALVHM